MGIIGGDRHFSGPRPDRAYAWTCKTCGTPHTTPMEQGCAACGTGTEAQAARAREEAQATREEVPVSRLITEMLTDDWRETDDPDAATGLRLAGFTPKARLTLATALAHYADHGTPTLEELPRVVIRSYARWLANQLDTTETCE